MTKKDRANLKAKIEQQIIEIQKDVKGLEEITQPIAPDNAIGRVSRMDAINNKSVNEASLRRSKLKLQKLRLALRKVDMPTFGTCSKCQKPIQAARLMFLPESTSCIKCAK